MSTFNSHFLATMKSNEHLEFSFIHKFHFSENFLQQVFLQETEINKMIPVVKALLPFGFSHS